MFQKIKQLIKNNVLITLFTAIAILTYLLWFFSVNEFVVILVYTALFILFLKLKLPRYYLIILMVFSLLSYHGDFKILEYRFKFTLTYHYLSTLLMFVIFFDMLRKKVLIKGKLFYPMIAILIYSLISVIWSPQKIISLNAVLLIFVGYFKYSIILNIDKSERISLKQLSILTTLFGLVLSLQLFKVSLEYVGPFMYNKIPLFELWDNPNLIAGIFTFVIPVIIVKYFFVKDNKKILYFIGIDLFIVFGAYLTQSRGLYFGLITALLFTPIIYYIPKKITLSLFIGMCVSFVVFTIITILLKDNYPKLYDFYNEFSTSRIELYEIAYNNFMNSTFNKIFGTGVKSSKYYIQLTETSTYYHSFIFQIIATLGVVGLTLYSYLFYKIYKILEKVKNKIGILFIIAVVAYLSHALVDIGFEYQYLGVLFYMLIGFIERRSSLEIE